MRRAVFPLLALTLLSCGREGATPQISHDLDGPIEYRIVEERQNALSCVEGPDFFIARTEEEWIDAIDMETSCQPESGEIELPRVDFDTEIGVAAWWRTEGCLGWMVKTGKIERNGAEIVVQATATGPGAGVACATARGTLESFLALERSARFSGTEPVRFVLDGETVVRVNPGRGV